MRDIACTVNKATEKRNEDQLEMNLHFEKLI